MAAAPSEPKAPPPIPTAKPTPPPLPSVPEDSPRVRESAPPPPAKVAAVLEKPAPQQETPPPPPVPRTAPPPAETVQEARVPVVPPPAPPPPGPRFCPAAGTRIATTTGETLTFGASDAAICTLGGPGMERRFVAFAAGPEARQIQWHSRPPAASLQPGMRFAFVSQGMGEYGPSSWYHEFSVKERKRVRVPAGEFDVLVIREDRTGWGGSEYEAVLTHYFAPELGFDVKQEMVREYRNLAGGRPSPMNRGAPQYGPLGGKSWEATQVLPPS
jgi:hypothetical protein